MLLRKMTLKIKYFSLYTVFQLENIYMTIVKELFNRILFRSQIIHKFQRSPQDVFQKRTENRQSFRNKLQKMHRGVRQIRVQHSQSQGPPDF